MKIVGFSPSENEVQRLSEVWAAQSPTRVVFVADLNTRREFSRTLVAFNASELIVLDKGSETPVFRASFSAIEKVSVTDHSGLSTVVIQLDSGQFFRFYASFSLHRALEEFVEQLELALQDFRQGDSSARVIASPVPRLLRDEELEEGGFEEPVSSRALLRLWRFAHPYRWRLFAGLLLTLLSTAATLVAPYLSMPLMDEVLIPFQNGQPMNTDLATFYLGGLLLSAVVAAILSWARTYLLALVSERIGSDLRTTTFNHLMSLSLDYFSAKRTGDLIARVSAETDRINLFLSLHALDFITDVIMILMTAVILMNIDFELALLTLLPLPLIGWMIHLVREKLRTGFEKVDRVWGEVTNILTDTIPGIRVVKAFAQERRESDRFLQANTRNLEVNDRINKTWSLFAPTVSLLTELGILVIWAAGIWMIMKNDITVGVLTAFLAYIGRFYTRLDSMSRIVSVTQKAAAGSKRIFDILDYKSSVPEAVDAVKIDHLKGELELRNVSFRYGSRQVLDGVNLKVKQGEMIGLVGHSGSGKSTLVNLLCRFYDVSDGEVLADGIDIRQIEMASYRRNIGLVLQEPYLFFGTIAENIAYGRPNATRQEIIAAARLAHAHEFILRLQHGYDSLVGERGQSLSGGERQRISIARALLIDPKILILDEATSSVDSQTEKEIQKALDNLVKGRTTIAIAHRLSTLRKADRIVVMDRGKVVEEGPHDELLAAKSHFWHLHQAQEKLKQEQAQYD
ncbi:MAG TPA: ABC transporter ATP-binding protein [Limnobacter sp.]|nr:ABC transporter ATP-binding protein [Limnobacter sp.]